MSSSNQVKNMSSNISKSGIKMSKAKLIELIKSARAQDFNVVSVDGKEYVVKILVS